MVKVPTEEELILSSAWAQLAELGYGKDGKRREPFPSPDMAPERSTSSKSRRKRFETNSHNSTNDRDDVLPSRLALSSSDEDDDDDAADTLSTASLRRRIQRFSELKIDPSKKEANHALLSHLAAIHLSAADYGPYDETNIHETRSSYSSPGKMNFTIRERLGKMSRKERRDLLLKSVTPDTQTDDEGNGVDNSGELNTSVTTGDGVISSPVRSFDFEVDDSFTRLKRQANYGPRRKEVELNQQSNIHRTVPTAQGITPERISPPPPPKTTNRIALHVYDLFSKDTLMQLPFGCVCEIGKCFTQVNTALLSMGTGVYHVGVEVNGIEYAYGATSTAGKTGIFSCIPKTSPGYQYRTTIRFGDIPLVRRSWVTVPVTSYRQNDGNDSNPSSVTRSSTAFRLVENFVDGREVIKEMANEYMGVDYDLLRKNCCTFAHDACIRLGVDEHEIPSWFRNLAETGAMTQDMANATFVQPLNKVLSGCDITSSESSLFDRPVSPVDPCESGFEIVARRNATNTKDVVVVIDAKPEATTSMGSDTHIGFVRTPTWAY